MLTHIMYVDDEPDIQAVVKLALEAVGGIGVRLCSSGKEAIAVVGEDKPQMILLDVMMPDMDGMTTLQKLRGIPELGSIPVVFMTAKVQRHEIEQYKQMGAVDVICKPFDPMTLADEVRKIWQRFHEARKGG